MAEEVAFDWTKAEEQENLNLEQQEVVEQPEQQTQQESSLNEEATPSAEAKPADQPAPQPELNVEEIRAQMRQELEQTLRAEYESKQPTFANEQIKKLNELAQMGVDTESPEFWKWQTIKPDEININTREGAEQIKKLELKLSNPALNDSQIERLFNKQYKALVSSYSEDDEEYIEALEDLKIDAITARTKVSEYKAKVTLPTKNLQQTEQERIQQQQARERFIQDVRTNVQTYKEEPIKLTDDLTIMYQPTEDTKQFIEASILNDTTFFSDNYVKDGQVNYGMLRRDLARLRDFDKITKTIFEQGISVGQSKIADTLENSSTDITQRKQEVSRSYEEQIAAHFANQALNKRF